MIRKAYTWGVDLVSVSALCQFCNVPGFENNPRDLSWWSEHPFLNDGSFEIMQCFAWGQHSLCRSSLNLSRFKFIIQLCQVFEYLWGKLYRLFQPYMCNKGDETQLTSQTCRAKVTCSWKYFWKLWVTLTNWICAYAVFSLTRRFPFGLLSIQAHCR